MKFFVTCHIGAEEACQRELYTHNIKSAAHTGLCTFETDEKEFIKKIYYLQTILRAAILIEHKKSFEECDFKLAQQLISPDKTFRATVDVRADAIVEDTAQDIAARVGERIDRSVDLVNPDEIVFVNIGSSATWGLDITGDISKRYYRVFTNARSVKGTLAASLIYYKEWAGELIDPFANTGEIPIEQALRATNTSPLQFLKHMKIRGLSNDITWSDNKKASKENIWCVDPLLSNIRTCKKNAKLAGVEHDISYSRLDTDWLDTKFSDKEIGAIITIPPPVSRRTPDDKHLKELCYQASHVLSDKGVMVIACLTDETADRVRTHAKTYNLKLISETVMYSGLKGIQVMCYGRV